MLFNSYAFILLFLPLTVAIFHLCRRLGWRRGAFVSLALASLAFYGWWSLKGLALLVVLMAVNFGLVQWLIRQRDGPRGRAKAALAAGLVFNLAVLGYFKYANFFLTTVDQLTGLRLALVSVGLPLGISFFTFQKIALLVDCYRGKVDRMGLLEYVLFVSFFPQLIAGPIVHHSEVVPQFRAQAPVTATVAAQGLAIFTLGLAKKVLLADHLGAVASPIFATASEGPVDFGQAWIGALAYTLQLYFDFSGYSEMAIGCALLFGVRLPLNFDSPYKSASIIEFWRRWHMTLSRFLRDYLYIGLGGNRHGKLRRYLNLFLTMLLGGLWHGAGWTFLLWGALHGVYLMVNHAWRALAAGRGPSPMGRFAGAILTFLAVVAGWVLFRAPNFDTAQSIYLGMTGFSGIGAPTKEQMTAMMLIAPLLALVWIGPNTQTLTSYVPEAGTQVAAWGPRFSTVRALATGALFACAFLSLTKVSEFLYFQF